LSSEALKIVVIRGSTVRIESTITDFDGAALDPDSHVIKLLKPDGTQQGSDYTSPTKTATGEYYQDIAVPADGSAGEWSIEWKVTKSSKDSIERVRFKVVA
jgi:hypothetical protein